MTLEPGSYLSHYKITAEIGRGGMGIVYRTVDVKLNREVALKVLPPELVADPERKRRFVREAQAASALEHPHIAVVHKIDEVEGVTFIVMELIRGEKLLDMMNKGRLPVARSLELATEAAEGLARAHDKGIVHRDLKPANIMVTEDGHAKILDFGLAKLVEPLEGEASEAETALRGGTEPGKVMGTVSYMSPEQARGQKVDHRSDIFSFGTVVYEMLTGETPFKAPSGPEILNAIINTPTPPLRSSVAGDINPELQRLLDKCLRKDPEERYQTIKDVVVDLRAVRRLVESAPLAAAPSPSESQPSIAVLPFADMSPQKDQDYFCEGMAEEIINALTKIGGLRVAARTSTFQFKGKAEDIGRIGEALRVKTLLEGSVRTSGSKLRVTAQLINVADGYHLWSERYDREAGDVFDIQDDIASNIVDALKAKLGGEQEALPIKRPTGNLEAYHLYMKGRYYWHRRHEGKMQEAIRFFEQALEKDASYALAHVGLADSFTSLGSYGFISPKVAYPKAKAAAERALELDDNLGEAHAALAWIRYYFEWDWSGAEREYKRALELNPAYLPAYGQYASLLSITGRTDEADAYVNKAKDLDPFSRDVFMAAGIAPFAGGQYERAIAECQEALRIHPDHHWALITIGLSYYKMSMHDEAVAIVEKAVTLFGRTSSLYLALLGLVYGGANRRNKAQEVLKELEERAYEERHPYMMLSKALVDDRLRLDPRFGELSRRMGFS